MRLVAVVVAALLSLIALPASAQLIPMKGRLPEPVTTDKENLWLLDLSTGGRVTVWLRPDVAPKTVERIKQLTRKHFYDGLTFHRVIPGFMAQGGDPKGDGSGGSDQPDLKAEFNYLPHVRGTVSMARASGEDSANSQFFIMTMPRHSLDGKYTAFGRVLDGMQWVDAIPPGDGEDGAVVGTRVRILHAYIASDNPPPYTAAAPVALPAGEAPVSLTGPKAAPAAAPAPAPAAAAPAKTAPKKAKK
jgi:peptidylprolyl isomerase